jgi:hypothetical protein
MLDASQRSGLTLLVILQRPVSQGVPLPSGDFGLELLIPKLVLVFIQPGAQLAQFSTGKGAQLLGKFLNPAHPRVLPYINSDINSTPLRVIFSCGD